MGLATKNRKAVDSSSLTSLLAQPWTRYVGMAVLFSPVALILFSRVVMGDLSHDEYQFIAGAQFFRAKGLLPYLNYPFLHMPYMPVLYGLALFAGGSDFLTTRLVSELFTLLSLILVFVFTTHLFRGTKPLYQIVAGLLAVLLFITDPSLVTMDGRGLNHSLPSLLSIGMLWVYWQVSAGKQRRGSLFFCGLLAGIAIGIRLSYAVILAPMLFAVLFDPLLADRKEKLRGLAAFGAGLAAALLPAGILFLAAPKAFIYGNFHYIALNTIYRKNLGYAVSMTLVDKLAFFYKQVLSNPANLLLYLSWLGFLIAALVDWLRSRRRETFLILFVGAFGLVLLAAAFAPTPLWPQYFFGPVPFLILGLFLSLAVFLRPQRHLWLGLAFLLIFGAVLIAQPFTAMARDLRGLAARDTWTTTQMDQLGQAIRAASGCTQPCKILTLVPILPLESGLDTYPVFTVGSFAWRTAPILSRDRRETYGIISSEDLADYLSSDPPAAVLTGTEANYDGFTKYDPGGLDQPFVDYAARNNFRPVKILDTLGPQAAYITLWVR